LLARDLDGKVKIEGSGFNWKVRVQPLLSLG